MIEVAKDPQVWGLPAPTVRVGPPDALVRFGPEPTRGLVWQLYPDPIVAAADKWLIYNLAKKYLGDGTVQLGVDPLKLALFLSTSNAATLTNDEYGDLTNEHANANGYTTGGKTLANITWTESTGTVTLDNTDDADSTWTASGGSITCRFGVIYANVTRNGVVDPLLCYSLLDNSPADVTATDGNNLAIKMHASGIIAISGGSTP